MEMPRGILEFVRGERWDYETRLKEYVLLLATKGKLGLESMKAYPRRMGLGPIFHDSLEDIRAATLDGRERWALVGVKDDARSLWMPTVAAVGYDKYIPGELRYQEEMWAREEFGIVAMAGDVHSHPRRYIERRALRLPFLNGRPFRGGLSPADFYIQLTSGEALSFMGVVDGEHNLFSFRTKESADLGYDKDLDSQSSFEKYWYERYGYLFILDPKKKTLPDPFPILGRADPQGMNFGIAQRYKLALYLGEARKDLRRIYP